MGWRRLGGEVLGIGLMLGVITGSALLFGGPPLTARALVLLTLALVATRLVALTVPMLWRRWRGPGPPLPTGRYGE